MRNRQTVMIVLAGILSTGCSTLSINEDYAHLVTHDVKYDICTVTSISRVTTKDAAPDEDITLEVADRMETLMLEHEEFRGASVGKVKSAKGQQMVLDSFRGIDRQDLGNSIVSKPLLDHFREKGVGDLLLLIRHDGFYRSGGSRAFGVFAGLVTYGGTGGHVSYSQYSALSDFRYCLSDKKSGQVIAFNGEAKETDPRSQGRLAGKVRGLVGDINTVRKKGERVLAIRQRFWLRSPRRFSPLNSWNPSLYKRRTS